MEIREMAIADYERVIELMHDTPGVKVRSADSRQAVERYLARNPGLSFVALKNNEIIGCAMCGHDGRRGYLQHVLVLPEYRRQGIASKLVDRCLSQLENIGIFKSYVDVVVDNDLARKYWNNRGWTKRDDIIRYSFNRSQDANA